MGDTLLTTLENTGAQELSNLTVFTTSPFMEPFLGTLHSVENLKVLSFYNNLSPFKLTYVSFNSQGTAYIGNV